MIKFRQSELENLSPLIVKNLTELSTCGLSADLFQQTALEILKGHPLRVAFIFAQAQVERDNRPSGFESINDEDFIELYKDCCRRRPFDPGCRF